MSEATPMMRQYQEAKAAHPDALLFFHVGDFYELFFEDAVTTARELSLTLTSRDGEVPMCGVPVHAAETYFARLVAKGYKVAVCDQLEDPRQVKGLVRRAVTRVLTPGTYEGRELEGGQAPSLAALVQSGARAALAWMDSHSLAVRVMVDQLPRLVRELARLEPEELLLPAAMEGVLRAVTVDDTLFALPEPPLPEPGVAEPAARRAVAALWRYSMRTAGIDAAALRPPELVEARRHLLLDEATLLHLEVFRRPDGSRAPTLFSVIDRTVTAGGRRRLREWLLRPLADRAAIAARLEQVAALVGDGLRRESLRRALGALSDAERAVNRLASGRGGVPELYSVLATLQGLPAVREALAGLAPLETAVARLGASEAALAEVRERLERELRPEADGVRDGGAIRDGVLPELDEARRLARGGREELLRYEERVRAESGIRTAKVGYNRVFGYYIEVGRAHAERVPGDWRRRQTLAAAERYVTPFLADLEARIAHADERRQALEAEAVGALRAAVLAGARELYAAMDAVAELDSLGALATVAAERGYVRPEVGEGLEVAIEGGRHPVLEAVLPPGRFVPNDLTLGEAARLIVITGPNMAGKSTLLRQTALLQILAQIGSFVPARAMRTGVVEAIYTRIGAADDLAGGRSTFMVEMSEVARILTGLDRPSLVLLDEVGRGTSTYDGLSLAWAIAEELHDHPEARTLLATHYLELADLPRTLPAARNLSVAVLEREGDVVFLHRLVDGPADRSYGIHVAKLAGLPSRVLERAQSLLAELEAGAVARRQVAAARAPVQLAFRFLEPAPPDPIVVELRSIDVDRLRPVEALVLLERLVRRARGEAEA